MPNKTQVSIAGQETMLSIILKELVMLLEQSGNEEQALVMGNLLNLLAEEQVNEFVNTLYSAEIWGGAGAVWEVSGFKDQETQRKFWSKIIELTELMKLVGIKNAQARSAADACKRLLLK